MKVLLKYLKVVILSILTFGIYGAYWIFVNMMNEPDASDDPELGDSEKAARHAQDTIALTWLNFINR